jgi:hypothetical protein
VWVLVWYYVEEIEARWNGEGWVDRDGWRLPDMSIACWREIA